MGGNIVSDAVFAACVVVVALCCSDVAKSEPQTSAPSGTESLPHSEAAVRGDRDTLERRVSAYVEALARYPGLPGEVSPVRWNTPICLRVVGRPALEVKTISDRLSQIGASAGAPLARTPCQPNLVIVATSEPERVLDAWYSKDKRLFGEATPAQIQKFLEDSKSRPVRVWYNIDTGRKSGTRNGHFIPSNQRAESSVFVGKAVFDFVSVLEVIDTQRTEHITLEQLAAYVAMSGLTTVDLDADLESAPSVLRLFAPSAETPPGLSRWDTAFLKAVYQSNQTSRTRRFEIVGRVVQDISR